MLRQIAEEPPVAFRARGVAPWRAVERALARALAKKPEQRFPTMRAFESALSRAYSARTHSTAAPNANLLPQAVGSELTSLTSEMLQETDVTAQLFARGITSAPTASVRLGSAGI